MPRKRASILLAVLFTLIPGWAIANNELVAFERDQIAVPENLTEDEAMKALMTAFVMRSWTMTKVSRESGYIDAEFPVRRHIGRVRARINDGAISFHYREGENLPVKWRTEGTREGTTVIVHRKESDSDVLLTHRNYLSWIQELARTVDGTLRLQNLPDG